MKPEAFFFVLMDRLLENSHGTLLLYMVMAVNILYAQNWKYPQQKNGCYRCWNLQRWLNLFLSLEKRHYLHLFLTGNPLLTISM